METMEMRRRATENGSFVRGQGLIYLHMISSLTGQVRILFTSTCTLRILLARKWQDLDGKTLVCTHKSVSWHILSGMTFINIYDLSISSKVSDRGIHFHHLVNQSSTACRQWTIDAYLFWRLNWLTTNPIPIVIFVFPFCQMDPSLKKPSSGEAAAAAAPVRPQRPFTEYNVSSDHNWN